MNMHSACQILQAGVYRRETSNTVSLKITEPMIYPKELCLLFPLVYQ